MSSSRPDPRTESGERRINLPADLQATRVSDRFRLPDEALPSEPPPPAPLGDNEKTPAVGTATAHIPIPEKIKLLEAALPTPQSFEPASIPIPKNTPPPQIETADEVAEPLEAPAASERPLAERGEWSETSSAPDSPRRRSPSTAVALPRARRRQIASAVALFVILVSASALAIRLFDQFLFQ